MEDLVVIISFSNIDKDSRVKRQIKSLKKIYKIIVFGYGHQNFNEVEFHKINNVFNFFKSIFLIFLLFTSQFQKYSYIRFSYKKIINTIKNKKVKAYILNDCFSWPLMNYIDKEKCIVDAHEYTPEEFNEGLTWKLVKKNYKNWCASYVKLAKFCFSVEKNLCNKWQLYSGKYFQELRNYSNYHKINKKNGEKFPIKIIHHGIYNKSRKIENMIKAVIDCGNQYEGYFYLETNSKLIKNKLKMLTKNTNVNIMNPILEDDLIKNSSNYDISILSIYPSNINYKYCLPNKLFQFIQSRLPIVSGPTPSIIEIIEGYGIGIIAESFNPRDLSKAILSLSIDNIIEMKKNCDIAARELCWETESLKLFDKIKKIGY